MKNKIKNILGFTLMEILIGIVISSIMMAAMFTSYNVVNNTYSQVTDRAKISTAGRDVIGMLLRDIRLAGFKYHNDNPNGSLSDIAGIFNKEKNVLGMMPHPERASDQSLGSNDGFKIFQSILEA